jgi:glycosyltransferase involved in cell wall biosynthesis
MVTTVMSMDVPDLLPTHTPLVVGTAELARAQAGIRPAYLMEPWIDTATNRPGAVATDDERSSLGISPSTIVVTVVGRLTTDLEKLDGVLCAMDVVAAAHRAGEVPWRLLVVGDGPGLPAVQEHARAVNAAHGTVVVSVLGARLDPRGAYACADIVLGWGALR